MIAGSRPAWTQKEVTSQLDAQISEDTEERYRSSEAGRSAEEKLGFVFSLAKYQARKINLSAFVYSRC